MFFLLRECYKFLTIKRHVFLFKVTRNSLILEVDLKFRIIKVIVKQILKNLEKNCPKDSMSFVLGLNDEKSNLGELYISFHFKNKTKTKFFKLEGNMEMKILMSLVHLKIRLE